MKYTEGLKLPIYDNPEEDLFKINDINASHNIMEKTFNDLTNCGKALEDINIAVDTANRWANEHKDVNDLILNVARKAYYVNTLQDIIEGNFKNGDYVITMGYSYINDGGNACYKIVDSLDANNEILYNRMDSGLYAMLIVGNSVNINQLGAKGDGVTDDTAIIKKAVSYALKNNKALICATGKRFLVKESINVENLYVNFNCSTLTTDMPIDLLVVDTPVFYGTVKNIVIDCNSIAISGLDIRLGRRKYFENIKILNVPKIGLKYESGYEINFKNAHICAVEYSKESVGIVIGSGDSTFTDIVVINAYTAVKARGKNFFHNLHGWIYNKDLCKGSKFIDVNYGHFIGSNIYSDTYQYSFWNSSEHKPCIQLTDSFFFWNDSIMTNDSLGGEPVYIYYNAMNSEPHKTVTTQMMHFINTEINARQYGGSPTFITNEEEFYGVFTNCINNNTNINKIYCTLKNINGSVTTTQNKIKRITAEAYSINYVGYMDTVNIPEQDRVVLLGQVDEILRPNTPFVDFIPYGNDEWSVDGMLYCYIGTDGIVKITVPRGLKGVIYFKLNKILHGNYVTFIN